jgi:hypothetical protein
VRALTRKPRALLLDEVTRALDPEIVGEALGIVRERKGDGMTMAIATHQLGFAREFDDGVRLPSTGVSRSTSAAARTSGARRAPARAPAPPPPPAAPPASASSPTDPGADIPLGPLPRACSPAPTGSACETAAIGRLDAARAKLGLGPYRLGANFVALAPPRQLLILANLDRIAYSRTAIRGLSLTLDAIAKQGAREREDPNPWPVVVGLPGQTQIGFASNWAGGAPNAPVAYYEWMYDDGYGSGNLDCSSPSAPGCWGHRRTVLAFAKAPMLTMGAAVVPSKSSYALTIVETSKPAWPYSYTWAQAMADGAGR